MRHELLQHLVPLYPRLTRTEVESVPVPLQNITLMENALILDFDDKSGQKCSSSAYEGFHSQPTTVPAANIPTVSLPAFLTEPKPTSTTSISDLPDSHSTTNPAPMHAQFSIAEIPLTPGFASAHPQAVSALPLVHAAHPGSESIKTWQESLASPTNLDKLSALQKEMNSEKPNKTLAQSSFTVQQLKLMEQQKAAQQLQDRIALETRQWRERGIHPNINSCLYPMCISIGSLEMRC